MLGTYDVSQQVNKLESWFLQFDVVLQRTSIFKAVMILFVFVFMNTDSILF